jgi:hypothetical protein
VESDALQKRLASLQNELQSLQRFVASSGSCVEGDGVQACFGAFLPAAQERVGRLHESCASTLAAVDATAVSFGEPQGATKPEEWFGALFDFCTAYRAADEKAQRQKRLQERDGDRQRRCESRLLSEQVMGPAALAA